MVIDSAGHLGTVNSSARFKDNIRPMKDASEAILRLEPVTFRYKKELDPAAIPQFGLVAEEVAKVDGDLVARDNTGRPYTVRYEAVNAMLLNEFLKEHRMVQEQRDEIAQLKASVAAQQAASAEQQDQIKTLTAAVKEQAAEIQAVAVKMSATEAAPRVVTTK